MEKPDLIMVVKVRKFGNSYHVIIPREQVEALGLDRVKIEVYRLKKTREGSET
jgi:antitoxin component of MazEF toxin-antitoxin module